jgi:hypothetical protein
VFDAELQMAEAQSFAAVLASEKASKRSKSSGVPEGLQDKLVINLMCLLTKLC